MPFNPSEPFEVVDQPSGFDPSKPFEVVKRDLTDLPIEQLMEFEVPPPIRPKPSPYEAAELLTPGIGQRAMGAGTEFTQTLAQEFPEDVRQRILDVANIPTDVSNILRRQVPGMAGYVERVEDLPRPELPKFDEEVVAKLPPLSGLQPLAGAANAVARTAEGLLPPFAPPEVGLTLPLLGGEGAIAKGAQLYFGTEMFKALPDQIQNAIKVASDPAASQFQKAEALAEPGVTAAMLALMGGNLREKTPIPETERTPNAPQERIEQKSNQPEYTGTEAQRVPSETGGGDSLQRGGEKPPQERPAQSTLLLEPPTAEQLAAMSPEEVTNWKTTAKIYGPDFVKEAASKLPEGGAEKLADTRYEIEKEYTAMLPEFEAAYERAKASGDLTKANAIEAKRQQLITKANVLRDIIIEKGYDLDSHNARRIGDELGLEFRGKTESPSTGETWQFEVKTPEGATSTAFRIKAGSTPEQVRAKYEQVVTGYKGKGENAPRPPKPAEAPPISTQEQTQLSREAGMNEPERVTSVKNAVVDKERADRGLPPAMEPARRAFGTVWDEAMKIAEDNPKRQDDLINELRDKPRALTDTEDALLLQRQVDLQNQYAKEVDRLNKAAESGDTETLTEANVRKAKLEDDLLDLYNIGKRSGTESGRGLNARKMLAAEDFTLASMVAQKRAANKGAPLNKAQEAEITRLNKLIETTQKAFDDYVQKTSERRAEKTLNELTPKTKTATTRPPRQSMSEKIVLKLEEAADGARARLKERLGRTSAGVDPTILSDVAIIGAAKIARGVKEFAAWSKAMVDDLGEWIKPHLKDAFDAAKNHFSSITVGNVRETIKAKLDAGNFDISRSVQQLARHFVEQGIRDRDALIDAVHNELKAIDPTIDRRDTMDAISGYGKFKALTKDEISAKLRDLKGQMQQVAKLEDMQKGQAPAKTGVERRTPSDEERRLIQQVNAMKKKGGFEVTDPEKQLKSSLDSIKTRLRNQISDLEQQLRTREKIVKEKRPSPSDAETEQLKSQRDELQKQYDEVFPKPGITDEQRIAGATKALESSIAEIERRIKEKDVSPTKPGSKTPSTPALEALRAKRDALREELQLLRDADEGTKAKKAQAAVEATQESIAELTRRINEGDIAAKAKPKGVTTPELEQLRAERSDLQKILNELRSAAKRMPPEEIALKAVQKSIAELERRINEGDIAAKSRVASVTNPALEALRAQRADLQKILTELRNAAKPKKTPEEIALQAYKTRLKNVAADYSERLANQDFTPKQKKSVALDQEATQLKARAEEAKLAFKKGLLQDRLKQRSFSQKTADALVKWRRAMLLSSPVTLAKLTAAAIERGVFTPLEEVTGAVLSKVPGISKIAKEAPRQGGLSVRAEAKALTDGIVKGMKDSWDILRRGRTALEVFGEEKMYPREWIDFFGELHGALKAPTKRNEFARSFQKRVEYNMRKGVDVTDPIVQTRIAQEAYLDANRSIFMQDNRVVTAYKAALRTLEQPTAGKGAKAVAATARFLLPIVKVPTNIVAEALQNATGLVTGSVRAANALRKGVETLTPEHADLIMQDLKKGSLGGALMLTGFLLPNMIGGYYQPGQKRKPGDVKFGSVRIGDTQIPSYVLHNPLLEMLQLGATIRRVADSKLRKKDTDPQGLGVGIMAGALGLVDEVPFVRETTEITKAFNPHERSAFMGELSKSVVVPQFLEWTARQMDKDAAGEVIRRDPHTITEWIKTGVPGLRKEVPKKKPLPK